MTVATDLAPRTIPALLEARRSAAPAVIYGSEVTSYAELDRLSRRAAGGLARLGVGPGDRVALWLPNTPAWLVLDLACARLGAIAVAVNTRFRSTEVEDLIGRSGAKVLALWPQFKNIDFAGILAEVDAGALERVERLVVYRETDAPPPALPHRIPALDYRTLLAGEPLDADLGGPGSPCNIFTTSGTTRAPKLVLHKQSAIAGHAHDVAATLGFNDAGASLLQALPMCGVFGLCQTMAMLASGHPLVMTPVFDAEQSLRLIHQHRIAFMNGSDEMVERMLAASDEARPLASLHYFGYGRFNPMLAGLPAKAAARGLKLRGLYGMSEVQAFYAVAPEGDAERYATAGGKPVSGAAAVRVRDPESGRLLACGEQGELELRGPSLMAGYFGDEQATRAAFTGDGFLKSGDLGYTLPDGGFAFVTRIGDALRLGGFLVSPDEIEAHLERHPAVAGSVVVGLAQRQGQRAVAFVTLRPGAALDEADLVAHCRRGMAGYKVPARVFALDEFPTTKSANGTKVQRTVLREMARARV